MDETSTAFAHAMGGKMNELPGDHPARNLFVTLESSPNTYIAYPALGEVVVHEFDIHGNPLKVGFRHYQTDGTFGPVVALGLARECEWRNGFRMGAKTAISFADKKKVGWA